jgi:hypothetical protein
MSSTAALPDAAQPYNEDVAEYRSMSTSAVIGFIFGGLSVLMVIAGASSLEACFLMLPIPLLGIIVSLRALSMIRRMPQELTGRRLAVMGIVLSLVFLIGGVAYGGYVYITELPEGYTRLSFSGMEPDRMQIERGIPVPPEVAQLDDQKVFIKGYIRPESVTTKSNIKKFLLVRDNNQCCFGPLSQVKYHDQIQVELVAPKAIEFTRGLLRVGGTLSVRPRNIVSRTGQPVFSMIVDHIQ